MCTQHVRVIIVGSANMYWIACMPKMVVQISPCDTTTDDRNIKACIAKAECIYTETCYLHLNSKVMMNQ